VRLQVPDPEDDVPLPSGGFKEPAPVDDDEENQELPAETDPATGKPLDDLMSDDVIEDDAEDDDHVEENA
jgi:hypothetical protein